MPTVLKKQNMNVVHCVFKITHTDDVSTQAGSLIEARSPESAEGV